MVQGQDVEQDGEAKIFVVRRRKLDLLGIPKYTMSHMVLRSPVYEEGGDKI